MALPLSLGQQLIEKAQLDKVLLTRLNPRPEEGYHPKLRHLHEQNAHFLQQVITRYGFPSSADGWYQEAVEAAFLIVQHAISLPEMMTETLNLMENRGMKLSVRYALLSDRIRFFQRKPQQYGSQYDYDASGIMKIWWISDGVEDVDARRKALGLPVIADNSKRFSLSPRLAPEVAAKRLNDFHHWLVETGWCSQETIDQQNGMHL